MKKNEESINKLDIGDSQNEKNILKRFVGALIFFFTPVSYCLIFRSMENGDCMMEVIFTSFVILIVWFRVSTYFSEKEIASK